MDEIDEHDTVDRVDEILEMEQMFDMSDVLQVRFTPAEKMTLRQSAAAMHTTMAALIRQATFAWLDDNQPDYSSRYYHNLKRMTNRSE